MPTRTRTIHEWGTDNTVWIDHYAFTILVSRIREFCYANRIDQMSVLPEIVKHLVDELGDEFSESRKVIESMDEDVFKTWVEMLLRAA